MLSEQQKQALQKRDEKILALIESAKEGGISMPELTKKMKLGSTLIRNSIRRMGRKVRGVGTSRARRYHKGK